MEKCIKLLYPYKVAAVVLIFFSIWDLDFLYVCAFFFLLSSSSPLRLWTMRTAFSFVHIEMAYNELGSRKRANEHYIF